MKFRLLSTLSLLALLLASCASTTSAQLSTQATKPVATQAPTPTVIPVVTSRGPHLEASDPKTVSMASGGLQFVEFFEFW